MTEQPIYEQKQQMIAQALEILVASRAIDERETLQIEQWTAWYDKTIPMVTDIKILVSEMEIEMSRRRGMRLLAEDAHRAPNAVVTPGVTMPPRERMERSRDRMLARHPETVDEYLHTERKAGRMRTKKGAVRHVQRGKTSTKAAAPTRRRVEPVKPAPPAKSPGHEHLLTLAQVADGQRRTDRKLEPIVGNVLNYLKYVYLIPWLTIDRTSEGTVFTIDQELRDICEGTAPRPVLNGFSIRGFLKHLRTEIVRRRKENHDERYRRKWSVDSTLMVEQTAILDWIEAELDRVP